jgi:hypothetical protein
MRCGQETRGSLERAELGSVPLHRRDLQTLAVPLPVAGLGRNCHRITRAAFRPWKEIAEPLKCSKGAKH